MHARIYKPGLTPDKAKFKLWIVQDKSKDLESGQCKLINSSLAVAEFLFNTTMSSDSVVLSANHQDMQFHTGVIADSVFEPIDNLSKMDIGNYKESTLRILIRVRQSVVNLKEYLIQNGYGDTLLHDAIINLYHTRILRLVLNAPNPQVLDIKNCRGHTPLHTAVLADQSGTVRLLVLSGADHQSRSHEGDTPLHLACKTNNLLCAKALINPILMVEHAYLVNRRFAPIPLDLEIKNYDGKACLHIATEIGSIPLMRELLSMGADLEAREGLSGRTALMLAIIYDKQEVIEFLLTECRPDFETQNYARLTAYQVALSVGNYDLAERLVLMGADPRPLPDDDSSSDEDMDEDSDDDYAFDN